MHVLLIFITFPCFISMLPCTLSNYNMSRHLSIFKYIPKRRHIDLEENIDLEQQQKEAEEEEEAEEHTTRSLSSSNNDNNNNNNSSTSSTSSSSDLDIALTPECSPCQPINIQFPITFFSGKA